MILYFMGLLSGIVISSLWGILSKLLEKKMDDDRILFNADESSAIHAKLDRILVAVYADKK